MDAKYAYELFMSLLNNENVSFECAASLAYLIITNNNIAASDFITLINPIFEKIYGQTASMVSNNLTFTDKDNTKTTVTHSLITDSNTWLYELGTNSELSDDAAALFENWCYEEDNL